ncbi:MAG TPA: hypothetical protein DIV82_11570 [Brevundimonas diminuta]|nr:hypothetical protein [Brevundimonas diminuta]
MLLIGGLESSVGQQPQRLGVFRRDDQGAGQRGLPRCGVAPLKLRPAQGHESQTVLRIARRVGPRALQQDGGVVGRLRIAAAQTV